MGAARTILGGPSRFRATSYTSYTSFGQLLPQHLDLGVKLARIDRQLDALLLGLSQLGSEFGVLCQQLQQRHLDGVQGGLDVGNCRPFIASALGFQPSSLTLT